MCASPVCVRPAFPEILRVLREASDEIEEQAQREARPHAAAAYARPESP